MKAKAFITALLAICIAAPASALILRDENGRQYRDMPSCYGKRMRNEMTEQEFKKCVAARERILVKYRSTEPRQETETYRDPTTPHWYTGGQPWKWSEHRHDWQDYTR